ncbi:MAG: RloB family protein [Hyphomicrobiales bacterium]
MGNFYQKHDGERPLRTKRTEKKTSDPKETDLNQNIPDNYQKHDGTLSATLIHIISGGEKREKDYFGFFIARRTIFPRIKLTFTTDKGGYDVNNLTEKAIAVRTKSRKNDKVYAVTDVDHFYSQIKDKLPECKEYNIDMIISNPCFEIWLLYHKTDKPPTYLSSLDTIKIPKALKKHLNEEFKGGINPKEAALYIDTAISNSLKHYKEDKNNIPELWATNMHSLAQIIYNKTDSELESYRKEKEEKEKRYRKK